MSIESNSRRARVAEPGAEHTADDRLEVPHQPGGRLVVPNADPTDEFIEGQVRRHQSIPLSPSRVGLPATPLGRAMTSASFSEVFCASAGWTALDTVGGFCYPWAWPQAIKVNLGEVVAEST